MLCLYGGFAVFDSAVFDSAVVVVVYFVVCCECLCALCSLYVRTDCWSVSVCLCEGVLYAICVPVCARTFSFILLIVVFCYFNFIFYFVVSCESVRVCPPCVRSCCLLACVVCV